MYKKAFGAQRQKLLEWLTCTWLPGGPPICFIEGFPGVGKTALAGDLCEAAREKFSLQSCFEEVSNRLDPSLTDLFIDLAANLSSHCHQPEMEAMLLGEEMSLPKALDRALRNKVLIVIDDIQRLFKPDSGEPTDELAAVLSSIGSRRGHVGRLLLLSDRLLVEGRWSAEIPIKKLDELDVEEAVSLLDDRLAEAGLPEAVNDERKSDLVQALGRNPRAIETLVSSLAFESLDEVIGRHPGFWSVEDRSVSRDFLKKLEADLLERSISRLSAEHYRRLLMLSVHRKNFEQAVFQLLFDGKRTESRHLAHALVSHFLLKQTAGWYSVQPVVREIGLAHLKEHEVDFRQAHSRAADYYARPLKSVDASGFNSRLVNSFAEARYHLFHAGRVDDLRQLLIQMLDVARDLGGNAPVPDHPEVLNERIGILTILLEDGGPGGLHYFLARCLRARKGAGDLQTSIAHARKATSSRRAPADHWVLLAQLLDQAGKRSGAIDVVYKALDSVPSQDKRFALYHFGAGLLVGAKKAEDALLLLQEGILNVPAEKNLAALYLKAADIYQEQHRPDTAIGLLKEGLQRIPPKHELISIARALSQALIKQGRAAEAAELLRQTAAENAFDEADTTALREIQRVVGANNAGSAELAVTTMEPSRPFREPASEMQQAKPQPKKESPSKNILVMATEWIARQGGLSTFNRELCCSLAKLNHEVVCVVPVILDDELQSAKDAGVRLVAASPVSVGGPLDGLLRKLPLDGFAPDVIIGHGRVTGHAAKAQQEDSYPRAKRIHFVHMAPGEIEWYKGKEDAAQTAEAREQIERGLCKGANLVAAVGPRLHLEFSNLLSTLLPPIPVHQFIPGIRSANVGNPAPGNFCLVLGRAEDLELKGLDIAALAMAKLLESGSEFETQPELVIRGAPINTGTALREQLRGLIYPSDLPIRVKEYSADVDAIENDLRRAAVLLMPSRREGFGLVALEALQLGIPILVSNKSGFAEYLKTKILAASNLQQYVVRTVDDANDSADEWCKSIDFVLRDRKAAFDRTMSLKELLAGDTWETASAGLIAAALEDRH
ncbi:glycosyltransferase [Paucibacter sp. KCTC 42545]|uniref:glycosyltransferase n=1 Tax=Paucibacter sp. KCTC 42545 TaxID=1768242 RepID=UPI000733BC9A|nr:glycosyltransferase [Paucibacter sp. KCTC 42545]ALT79085.1 glycosyltransferase [Paucibacter sp. KCTC 42545]